MVLLLHIETRKSKKSYLLLLFFPTEKYNLCFNFGGFSPQMEIKRKVARLLNETSCAKLKEVSMWPGFKPSRNFFCQNFNQGFVFYIISSQDRLNILILPLTPASNCLRSILFNEMDWVAIKGLQFMCWQASDIECDWGTSIRTWEEISTFLHRRVFRLHFLHFYSQH